MTLVKLDNNRLWILNKNGLVIKKIHNNIDTIPDNVIYEIDDWFKDNVFIKNIRKKDIQFYNSIGEKHNIEKVINLLEMKYGSLLKQESLEFPLFIQGPSFGLVSKQGIIFIEKNVNELYIKYYIKKFIDPKSKNVLINNEDFELYKDLTSYKTFSSYKRKMINDQIYYKVSINKGRELFCLKNKYFSRWFGSYDELKDFSYSIKFILKNNNRIFQKYYLFGNFLKSKCTFKVLNLFGLMNAIIIE